MEDPAKYVIRALITARGVVERNDVVGAVFGQTEGLLGDELDLRALQDGERVGRIEVDIDSEMGTSEGTISIATDMDRVETAVLAAALETIERVGPCRAVLEVDAIEDVRAAKRREIVERARELLASGFEDVGLAGTDLVSAVRERTRPAEIDEYLGYPAGPDAATNDELIVVEGRADVLRLLEFGITNVIGVDGTDVAPEIAELTRERTVTAFFDGDRGGNLLLLELAQIGEVDYVTFAPPGNAVEDLSLSEITEALDEKVQYEEVPGAADAGTSRAGGSVEKVGDDVEPSPPLLEHIREIIANDTGRVRILGPDAATVDEDDARELTGLLDATEGQVETIVLDAAVDQRAADVAARHAVSMIVARERGEFTKRPTDVRILTADRLLNRPTPGTSTLP